MVVAAPVSLPTRPARPEHAPEPGRAPERAPDQARAAGHAPYAAGSGSPPGQPPDAAVRADMERRLGHSFADVRVHTDAEAAASARAMDAAAFTVGRTIVLGAGQRPDTPRGRAVLAHELVHVAQQSRGGTARPGAAQEREAERAWATDGSLLVREYSGVGVARLTLAELERGVWARVPDAVKPYVRPLAAQAKAELDKVVPPTTEIPAAVVEAVAHPVQAVQAAAVAAAPKVTALLPRPPTSLREAGQQAKAAVRDHLMETAGTAKGVVLEAGNIVDTIMWLPYAGHQALAATGIVDAPDGEAPAISGWVSSHIDTVVEGGDQALFGKPEQAALLSPYEQGELKGAIGTQIGLAFVGVEEVQVALKVLGAVGGAKGIYDSVKRNPGGWYKSPDFWASLLGLAMSVLGLKSSKAAGKLTQMVLRSGAVLNAVPAVWKLVADYDDAALAADPGKRQTVLKGDVVAIVKILANAIADAARGRVQAAHAPAGESASVPATVPETVPATVPETVPAAVPATEAPAAPAPLAHAEPAGPAVHSEPTAAPSPIATPPVRLAPPGPGPAVPPSGILRPLTAPLRLPVIEGPGPAPRELEPGSIGTYGRAVPNPHPFALDSNPPGAPGATRGGGRLPQGGREAAGVYAEHQTPAAVAHEVLPNHQLHGPGGRRRGGRDTQEAVTVVFPKAAKPHKDAADAALLRDVQARKAAGDSVAPIEVIARGAQHTLDATAQPGAAVPQEQITKTFFAEQDQVFRDRHGYTEVRPGQSPPAPRPPGSPALPDAASFDAHLDAAFAPHVGPKPGGPTHPSAGPGGPPGEMSMTGSARPPGQAPATAPATASGAAGNPEAPIAGPRRVTPADVAHETWVQRTLRDRMGVRPPPLPRKGLSPLAIGEFRRGITDIDVALRHYDEFRARAPTREIGLYRHSTTGEYFVMAGREGSVRFPPGDEGGRWISVVHNHPSPENALVHRNPSPTDVMHVVTAGLPEKHTVTAFIEHDLPEGGRRLTAVTVTHHPVAKSGDSPVRITLEWQAGPGDSRKVTYESFEQYERDYGARKVWVQPGSHGYQDYMRDAAQVINRRRNE